MAVTQQSGMARALDGRSMMTTSQIRPGFQTVCSYLAVQGAAGLVEFLGSAFGGEHMFQDEKGTHYEVRIGDSMVMIGDVGKERPAMTGQLFMYVSDPDELHKRAIEAGAASVFEPTTRDWGEGGALVRAAGIKDPCGNFWFLAGPKLVAPSN